MTPNGQTWPDHGRSGPILGSVRIDLNGVGKGGPGKILPKF